MMKTHAVRLALSLILVLVASCTLEAESLPNTAAGGSALEARPIGDGGVSDFYTMVAEERPARPGILIRQQPLLPHQSVPGAAENIRLLYSSTDGLDGKSIVAVSGSLFLPEGKAPEGGWPVVLWSHGTVGIADVCAPSWTGYVPFHEEYLGQWLDQKFAVVASDYQGLGTPGMHPYLATRPAAYSNLDIVRAIRALDYDLSETVLVVGQSQGAGAAIATAAYVPEYAPDIKLLGVVATGVPFFSPEGLLAVQEARPKDKVDPMLGYNFLALTLVEQLLPEFKLEEYVHEEALPLARAVRSVCNRDMRKHIERAGFTYNTTFKQSPAEPLKVAFAQMGYPTLAIDTPVFLGIGSADRDTPLRMQAGLAKKACAAGTVMQVHVYEGHDHLSVLNHSTVDSIPFVAALAEGRTHAGNCHDLPF